MTKPSDTILSRVNANREANVRPLTLDGGWECGDMQSVLIALLRWEDERASSRPSGKPASEVIFEGMPTDPLVLVFSNQNQTTAIRRIAKILDEQHAPGQGEVNPFWLEGMKCNRCGMPAHHNGGNCGAPGPIFLTGPADPIAAPPSQADARCFTGHFQPIPEPAKETP